MGWDSLKFKHNLRISSSWKIKNTFKPFLTVLLLRNSTNFAKVNNLMLNLMILKSPIVLTKQ